MSIVETILEQAQLLKPSQVPNRTLNPTKAAVLQDVLSAGQFEQRALTEEEKKELNAEIDNLTR
ncbi:hypothetical protein PG987_004814 [Apiospora arundinis]